MLFEHLLHSHHNRRLGHHCCMCHLAPPLPSTATHKLYCSSTLEQHVLTCPFKSTGPPPLLLPAAAAAAACAPSEPARTAGSWEVIGLNKPPPLLPLPPLLPGTTRAVAAVAAAAAADVVLPALLPPLLPCLWCHFERGLLGLDDCSCCSLHCAQQQSHNNVTARTSSPNSSTR